MRNAEGDPNRLREFAREFARSQVDAILAIGSASLHAAFETTRSVPIVALDLETDPVKAGMVGSLNRPGGNITGVFFDAPQIAGKWLQLLRGCLETFGEGGWPGRGVIPDGCRSQSGQPHVDPGHPSAA